MDIYLDEIFLVNFTADYFLMRIVSKEYFPQIKGIRIVFGAFLSTIVYCLWILYVTIPANAPFLLMTGILVTEILILIWSYKITTLSALLKTTGLLFMNLLSFGGVMQLCNEKGWMCETDFLKNWGIQNLLMFCCYLGTRVHKRKKRMEERKSRETYEIVIWRNGYKVLCIGKYDSGNLLKDSQTGRGIFVLDHEKAKGLLEEDERKELAWMRKQKEIPWDHGKEEGRWRIIAYNTVSTVRSWMPGIKVDRIEIKEGETVHIREGAMIGICKEKVFDETLFCALLPEDAFQ